MNKKLIVIVSNIIFFSGLAFGQQTIKEQIDAIANQAQKMAANNPTAALDALGGIENINSPTLEEDHMLKSLGRQFKNLAGNARDAGADTEKLNKVKTELKNLIKINQLETNPSWNSLVEALDSIINNL